MTSCLIPDCMTSSQSVAENESINFECFPNNTINLLKWREALDYQGPITNDSRICSLHFLDEDYELKDLLFKLKADAVPSMFLKDPVKHISRVNGENGDIFIYSFNKPEQKIEVTQGDIFCRGCLNPSSMASLVSIFDHLPSKSITIASAFFTCSNIMVQSDDKFSTFICINCVSNLTTALNIIEVFKATDLLLKDCFLELPADDIISPLPEPEPTTSNQSSRQLNDPTVSNEQLNEPGTSKDKSNESRASKEQLNKSKENSSESDQDNDNQQASGSEFSDSSAVPKKKMKTEKTNKQTKYRCPSCRSVFESKEKLDSHARHVHQPIYCTTCVSELPSIISLVRHNKNVHKLKTFVCRVCVISFPTSVSQQRHERQHHPCQYTCDLCGMKKLATKAGSFKWLRIHMYSHTVKRKLFCNFCSKQSHNPGGHHEHLIEKHNAPLFKCKNCQKQFKRYPGYKRHLSRGKDACDETTRTYGCRLCNDGTTFALKKKMIKHVKTVHAGETNCKLCKKTYNTSCSLEYHMRYHYDELKIICDSCGKKFPDYATLSLHKYKCVLKYTVEKKHSCRVCDKKFKFHNNCRRHEMTHQKFRAKCDKCPKSYSTKQSLDYHILTVHKKILNFKCDFCEKKFGDSNKRYRHCRQVHALQIYAKGPKSIKTSFDPKKE